MHEKFVAAVDLGTSTITAVLGKKDASGHLSIVAVESVDSGGCIRRGCIYNVEGTATKVAQLIRTVNAKQAEKIERVYVGVGGQSVRSATYSIVRKLPTDAVVDQTLLNSIEEECRNYEPELAELLDISSPEYFLDGHIEPRPLGVQCSEIKVNYQLIIGKPFIKQIKRSVEEKANIPVAGYFVSSEALAGVALTPKEKELGCALVDFGFGKTTLSIYKNSLLRYLVTIPLGSDLITKDICSLDVLEQEAETFKVQLGAAIAEDDDDPSSDRYTSQQIAPNELNRVVEARVDEILSNIIVQVKRAGFEGAIASGLVITGGGAALKRLPEAIKNKTGYQVRVAGAREDVFANGATVDTQLEHAQAIGLLALGTENCVKEVVVTPTPPQTGSIFGDSEMGGKTEQQPRGSGGGKPPKGGFIKKLKDKCEQVSRGLFDEQEQ